MAWLYLILGGVFEVGFTTCMRFTDGFRNIPWTLAFMVCIILSMVLLEMATRVIPLGTGYAIWTGIGALGTVAIGMAFFGEPATPVRILLVLGVVGCIAGLKLTSGH
ncbi:multidrug efflux SMR transporter [Neorhizobium galegae]|uniref:Guanidinium exporter n=2 Tax=Neorhizobium galegae bv. officinalis TaxID=323656 RepID=A0A0T7G0D2_NEOGA|nr:multidrug efflux SMR transporter [Neorhizobium galegae]KAA9382367.1 multidrug efflux SMR transporter [Neorhizobium galegae]KAB1109665.1 multidrug efflux SMR transporter [Neorhizobium galegae]MCM2501656.1 multidrug efflux SMR transporter [Neorhizobium galegae]MCQ1766744.1 multidrug efflux SMR transporter [Neorhizobium galegae]MCQ1775339.1 multidrug efflux SMR transporter [Neorhizobium galegae]